MLFQHGSILIGPSHLAVMLGLALDVFDHSIPLSPRHSECPVTVLPSRPRRIHTLPPNPVCGTSFDFFDVIRERERGMKCGKNVYMVLDATDAEERTFETFVNAPDVGIQSSRRSVMMAGTRPLVEKTMW